MLVCREERGRESEGEVGQMGGRETERGIEGGETTAHESPPHTIAQQAFASDPGAAKRMVENNLHNKRLRHSLSLELQGKLFENVYQDAAAVNMG